MIEIAEVAADVAKEIGEVAKEAAKISAKLSARALQATETNELIKSMVDFSKKAAQKNAINVERKMEKMRMITSPADVVSNMAKEKYMKLSASEKSAWLDYAKGLHETLINPSNVEYNQAVQRSYRKAISSEAQKVKVKKIVKTADSIDKALDSIQRNVIRHAVQETID